VKREKKEKGKEKNVGIKMKSENEKGGDFRLNGKMKRENEAISRKKLLKSSSFEKLLYL
jgi:hypothetical protein